MPKLDWDKAAERTGLTKAENGKHTLDRMLEQQRLPVAEIALDEIAPNPQQPRKAFDAVDIEGNTLAKLADDIRLHGILEPLLVVWVAREAGGYYRLVDGERRWRAADAAGLLTAPCRVLSQERWPRPLDERELFAISVSANYQRLDHNEQEKRETARRLRALGYTQVQIGGILGYTQAYVSQLLKASSISGLYSTDAISTATLTEIARMEPDEQAAALEAAKAGKPRDAFREERKPAKQPVDLVAQLQHRADLLVNTLQAIRDNATVYAGQQQKVSDLCDWLRDEASDTEMRLREIMKEKDA